MERASTRKQFTIMAKDRDVQRLNKIIRELSKDLESTKASLKKNQILMQTKQEKFEQQLSTSNSIKTDMKNEIQISTRIPTQSQ